MKGYGKRLGASNLKVQNLKRKKQNNGQLLGKFEALNPKYETNYKLQITNTKHKRVCNLKFGISNLFRISILGFWECKTKSARCKKTNDWRLTVVFRF